MKKILYFLLVFITILLLSVKVHASMAVPLPALPYVPPNTTEFLDLVFNFFGTTAANIQDNTEKLEAYVKIFQAIYGESWRLEFEKLLDVLNSGHTSGYLTFDIPTIEICNDVIGYALEHGVQYGQSWENAANVQQVVTMLDQRYHITCSNEIMQQVFNRASSAGMTNFGISYGIWGNRIWFFVLNRSYATMHVGLYRNGYYYFMDNSNEPQSGYFLSYEIANRIVVSGIKEEYFGGHGFPNAASEYGSCNASAGSIATVTAISSDLEDAIENGEASILTPFTDILNPYVSITINLPAIIPTPALTVDGVSSLQDELNITAVDTSIPQSEVEEIVDELQESYNAAYGDIQHFRLDLTEYFPFCIPFDVGRVIDLLVAEPEAPKIPWKFVTGFTDNWQPIWEEYIIDLSPFDTVAEISERIPK